MSFRFQVGARGTLVAAAIGFVVVLLDVSVVNVALQSLRDDLRTDVEGLQWVVNAYTLVFAALLLSAGALGDRLGARRVFMQGLALFTLSSVACGLATSLPALLAARAVQGLGAAMLVPNSLAMLQAGFPDPARRARAVGAWSAAGGVALAAGPLLGGLLIAHTGWRGVFLINLPIGAAGLVFAWRCARPDGRASATHGQALDLPGQLAACLALGVLAYALTAAGALGWGHPRVLGGLLLALALGCAFVAIEWRGAAPMLPLSLFRSAQFSMAVACGVVINFAYYGLIFVFSLFFQFGQHLSALRTGLAFLPMTAVLVVANIAAGRLLVRIGARRLMLLGLGSAALGYAALWMVTLSSPYAVLALPMLVAAGGIALMVPTLTNLTLSAAGPGQAGIAAGVLNAARQTGGVLGVAVCGVLVRDAAPAAFMRGLHGAVAICVALLVLAALACAQVMQRARAIDCASCLPTPSPACAPPA